MFTQLSLKKIKKTEIMTLNLALILVFGTCVLVLSIQRGGVACIKAI